MGAMLHFKSHLMIWDDIVDTISDCQLWSTGKVVAKKCLFSYSLDDVLMDNDNYSGSNILTSLKRRNICANNTTMQQDALLELPFFGRKPQNIFGQTSPLEYCPDNSSEAPSRTNYEMISRASWIILTPLVYSKSGHSAKKKANFQLEFLLSFITEKRGD
jgi:hypothetical protein